MANQEETGQKRAYAKYSPELRDEVGKYYDTYGKQACAKKYPDIAWSTAYSWTEGGRKKYEKIVAKRQKLKKNPENSEMKTIFYKPEEKVAKTKTVPSEEAAPSPTPKAATKAPRKIVMICAENPDDIINVLKGIV